MKPFFAFTTTNFGDHMNSWIWNKLIPELINNNDNIRLVGIGSLIKDDLDLVKGKKVIFGSGAGYGAIPNSEQISNWDFCCVRGPLTASAIGIDEKKSITDGAWLINRIGKYSYLPTKKSGVVFVPHWSSYMYGNWELACRQTGIEIVNPFDNFDKIIQQISSAEIAIVESLHGAIFADYFRTPWIPVASANRILHFKWQDWCQSLDLEYTPFLLPPSDYIDYRMQRVKPNNIDLKLTRIDSSSSNCRVVQKSNSDATESIYRIRTYIKGHARKLRSNLFEGVDLLRDSLMFSDWNKKHRESLSKYFEDILAVKPNLSSIHIRNTRIDQLNDALESMRRKYSQQA